MDHFQSLFVCLPEGISWIKLILFIVPADHVHPDGWRRGYAIPAFNCTSTSSPVFCWIYRLTIFWYSDTQLNWYSAAFVGTFLLIFHRLESSGLDDPQFFLRNQHLGLHLGRGHFPGFVKNRVPINYHGLSSFLRILKQWFIMWPYHPLTGCHFETWQPLDISIYPICIFAPKDHMTDSMTYPEAPSTRSWRLARRDGTGLTNIKRLVMAGDFSTRFLCCNGDMNPTARRTRIAGI